MNKPEILKKLSSIFMPVKKVKAETVLKGYKFNSDNDHLIVVETSQGPKIVNNCSEDYTVISNKEILLPFVDELIKTYNLNIKVSQRKDAQFYVDFSLPGLPTKVSKKDDIIPRMRIINSYNGRVKYAIELGFVRLVCTNGLTVPEGFHGKIKMMHTPGSGEGLALTKSMDMLAQFIQNVPEVMKPFMQLTQQPVKDIEARVQEIIENTKFPKRQAEEVMDRINFEINTLKLPPSDWLIYNGFNYQLNHNEAINTVEHKKTTLDENILLYLLKK
jgi:ASC-1-like (ASCH) protein